MLTVVWKNRPSVNTLLFCQLQVGECFRIKGRNAIYMKVEIRHTQDNRYRMLSIETGEVFLPTGSAVERVKAELSVSI